MGVEREEESMGFVGLVGLVGLVEGETFALSKILISAFAVGRFFGRPRLVWDDEDDDEEAID